MSDKLFTPRFFEGRELEYWMRTVSKKIGVNPPATLEELGEQSVTPFMSMFHRLDARISELEGKLTSTRHQNEALKSRISDLERSM